MAVGYDPIQTHNISSTLALIKVVAATSGLLRDIHGAVGTCQQIVRICDPIGIRRNSNADTDRKTPAVHVSTESLCLCNESLRNLVKLLV